MKHKIDLFTILLSRTPCVIVGLSSPNPRGMVELDRLIKEIKKLRKEYPHRVSYPKSSDTPDIIGTGRKPR